MGEGEKIGPLSAEQKAILEQRGVLSPSEIHKLASKTKSSMPQASEKAVCHSDYVDADQARELQEKHLVELDSTRP